MENIRQVLEEIDSKLSEEGFKNSLKKTEEFMGQNPINYLEEFNETMYHSAPEILDNNLQTFKYRIKHVLCAMSFITLDHWSPDFMKNVGPRIFKPLLEILNS